MITITRFRITILILSYNLKEMLDLVLTKVLESDFFFTILKYHVKLQQSFRSGDFLLLFNEFWAKIHLFMNKLVVHFVKSIFLRVHFQYLKKNSVNFKSTI